jgi:hypothetical protein
MANENDAWINAATAIMLLSPIMNATTAGMTIAARANDGVIRSRACRFVRGAKVQDEIELPSQFWWARGHAALKQNWKTGDFETWMRSMHEVRSPRRDAATSELDWEWLFLLAAVPGRGA